MQRICLLLITLVTGLSAMGNQLNLRRNLCETGQSQSVQYLHSTRNQDVYDAAQRAAHDYPERNLVYA